ncbi:transcriptional regulator, AbrB family [Pyrolobus fumarii 1A]|uniref:Transcriptional regulator, AbrB family n=1 Tax=Pyrolobus fumarii (strain DSM 11204 / 1A) TaxID=694429 RepID=G0ECM0_PYRF1|nr:AbrB/MazE/SpoVT family DNA-binding domain-containing protein [Pyrolobus fumarii]AEM39590.1 transcriptional regulator, AbrB family [Pyrolobus fumarii 1A]
MKITEIVRVDSKGRITIPMVVRDALNIVEGMHLILVADPDKREIVLSPIFAPVAHVYEIYLELRDTPGALAKVSEELAKMGVDQLTTQCAAVKRGEYAECVIVADFSKVRMSPEEVKQRLIELDEVRLVSIRKLHR